MSNQFDPEQLVFTLKRVQTGSPTFCARVDEFPDLEGFGASADRACFDLIAAIRAAIESGATPVRAVENNAAASTMTDAAPAATSTRGGNKNFVSLILPDKLFGRLIRLSAKRKISMDECIEALLTNAVRREMKSGRPPAPG